MEQARWVNGGEHYDMIVIGAGINGTGIARDAALRGLHVLLVDKTDIAAGTTSWSSRLIHGGLRYLEYAEIGLVRESLRERERLLSIAPHLVRPLPLTLPIYDYHRRGPLLIRAGMLAYDILSFDKSRPAHRMYDREAALAHEPGLNPDGLKAAARYYDAQVDFPERLAVENALDATAHGADLLTGTRVERLHVEAGVVRGVRVRDEQTGETQDIRGLITVNVAGSWVDRVLAGMGLADPPQRLVGGTKGSHIVVEPFSGAPGDALYIEAKQDGRPYFIIPWNGLYLIGTTDVRYDGDLDRVVPTEQEIAYLLTETNLAIPSADLVRDDVLYAYAGLRPLPYREQGSASSITRRHIVRDHLPEVEGLLSVIGGKLTTYRNLAEHVVDAAEQKLGRRHTRSRTADLPLPGGVRRYTAFAERFQRERPDWLDERSVAYLLRIYGIRARAVVALAQQSSELRPVLGESTGAIAATVAFAFTDERARTLTDALMRRTMIGYGRDAGRDAVTAAAEVCQASLGWSDARVANEIDAFNAYIKRFLPRDMPVAPATS